MRRTVRGPAGGWVRLRRIPPRPAVYHLAHGRDRSAARAVRRSAARPRARVSVIGCVAFTASILLMVVLMAIVLALVGSGIYGLFR